MTIANLFSKNLARPINGVVKADQQDDAVVWQELDEYVVTQELDRHLRRFFDAYLASRDNPNDHTLQARMGVWVSGFFGSGKSHFIKILSYLLANRSAHHDGVNKRAVEFFKEKLEDAMLFSDIRRAVDGETEVVLFNIDSKADSKAGREAILQVFMRVFNELQGFSSEYPYLAEMERQLSQRGQYDAFKAAFERETGKPWEKERGAFLFLREKVTRAMAEAMGISQADALNWFDNAKRDYALSVDIFAKRVNEYTETKPANYRLVFLVDEIGQFIGADTHLMLNLQTITEELGVQCKGKAWVIVTSQEDIDAVLGELKASKANDFSKIQGRFHTKLSLSSSNTDEVIQARLLEKTPAAREQLAALFRAKGDVLKNQLSFRGNKSTYKTYRDEEDFIRSYPFAPYHFQLLQQVFELIRKVGATGTHLAKGERSMLDAFQTAARQVADRPVGAMVPLYRFYPSIESFLEGVVKRTIDQAASNPKLDSAFDPLVLQTLFLIRYVSNFEPNIDNLVTLFLEEVDADRVALKRRIQESLTRLESETLINRNGDLYYFLTNEEVDVSREIKNVELASSEPTRLLAELIFDEIYKGDAKYRYPANKRDFTLNRFLDGHAHAGKTENDLTFEVISPLNDDSEMLKSDIQAISRSAMDHGRVVFRLPDNRELDQELSTYKRTEKYIRDKNGPAASTTLRRILDERAEENRQRKDRLIDTVRRMLAEADVFAAGNRLELKGTPEANRDEALKYLITNTYNKLTYLPTGKTEPAAEIKAVLNATDLTLGFAVEGADVKAVSEVRDYIQLMSDNNKALVLSEVIDRYGKRPYGWPEWDVAVLLARMVRAGEIALVMDGAELDLKESIEPLSKSIKWKQVKLLRRKKLDDAVLQKAKQAYKNLFYEQAPEAEDELALRLKGQLQRRKESCDKYRSLAAKGGIPGLEIIDAGQKLLTPLLQAKTNAELFEGFIAKEQDLDDLSQDLDELVTFYEKQLPIWNRLVEAVDGVFKENAELLESDVEAGKALAQLRQIRDNKRPFRQLPQVEGLLKTVEGALDRFAESARKETVKALEAIFARTEQAVVHKQGSPELLTPLKSLLETAAQERSITKLHYLPSHAGRLEETVLNKLVPSPTGDDKIAVQTKTVTVKPSLHAKKAFIETEADVEEFLTSLKTELMAIVQRQERARIQ